MKRLLALLALPLIVAVGGCSTLLGTGDWDEVRVSYTSGLAAEQAGDYTLVVTPAKASYTLDGKPTSYDLPEGTWDLLTTGVRTLGAKDGGGCLDGATLIIEASAGGSVKQSFEANSCDADGLLDRAKSLIEQVVNQLK